MVAAAVSREYCPATITVLDSVRRPAACTALTVIVIWTELKTKKLAPVSVTTTLYAPVEGGCMAANCCAPAERPASVCTTAPDLTRFAVNVPTPLFIVKLNVVYWPLSSAVFVAAKAVTVGPVFTVTVFEALHTDVGVVAESTLLKLYVVVDEGLTRALDPLPVEAPAHAACENQL